MSQNRKMTSAESDKLAEQAAARALDECVPSKMSTADALAYLQALKWNIDCALEALVEEAAE